MLFFKHASLTLAYILSNHMGAVQAIHLTPLTKNLLILICKRSPVPLTKYQPSLIAACITHRFHKHKVLLDENMSPRQRFPRLNSRFDVKHIRDDLHFSGISDPEVFRLAKKQKRLMVTLNGDDFRPMAEKSPDTGIISVTDHLRNDQMDSKLRQGSM